MTYPTNFLRLQASGTLYTDAERFSFSLNLAPTGGPAVAPEVVPVDTIAALSTFFAAPGVAASWARLDEVKVNEIGTDGRYTSTAETVVHQFDPVVPGQAATQHPPQCALAYTLHTSATRGRASRGRFFLPWGGTLGPDGRLTVAQSEAQAGYAATFINALEDSLPNWRVSVLSNIGTGTVRPVIGVSVGRVVDTIRSRRRSMPEENPTPAPAGTF